MLQPQSFIIQFHITERCNWHCKHCYQERNKIPPDLNLKQLLYIFNSCLFFIKQERIPWEGVVFNIVGGEPLIRKDFFQFAEILGKKSLLYGYQWAILSNGSLLTEKNVKKLKKLNLDEFQVSLEGMREKNDEIRGEGAFQKTVKAIQILTKIGIPVSVSLTLTKKNIADVLCLVKFLGKLGVRTLRTRRLIPVGKGEGMKTYLLQPQELKKFYLQTKEINKKLYKEGEKIRIVLGCEAGIFNDELLADRPPMTSTIYCMVTQGRGFVIMANGDIVACRKMPTVVGDSLVDNFSDVYHSQLMQDFRNIDKLHSFCKKCSNFCNCFGGVKCVTHACTKRWNIPDVQCWRAYKKLDQPIFKTKNKFILKKSCVGTSR